MGFGSGGYGTQIQQMTDQIQNPGFQATPIEQPGWGQPGSGNPALHQPPAGNSVGPGEPNNMNYGQMGSYNTLAQDMSRNRMGGWGFPGGMFNYSPFGNPYQSLYSGGGFGGHNGGYGGGWGGPGYGNQGPFMQYGGYRPYGPRMMY